MSCDEWERGERTIPDSETLRDVWTLVANPAMTMCASYHDAGSCWKLIEGFRYELRRLMRETGVDES